MSDVQKQQPEPKEHTQWASVESLKLTFTFPSAASHLVEELKLPACSSPRSSARQSRDSTEMRFANKDEPGGETIHRQTAKNHWAVIQVFNELLILMQKVRFCVFNHSDIVALRLMISFYYFNWIFF